MCDARAHSDGDLVKYYCEACERLVPPAAFRVEEGLLVLKCSRCKVETRGGPEQDEVAGSAQAPVSAPGPVIMLASSEAEPDPIEFVPTRPIEVPAAILDAIEAEARKARGKTEAAAPAPEKAPPSKLPMTEAAASNQVMLPWSDVQARVAPEPVAAREVVPEVASSRPAAAGMLRVVEPASTGSEDPFMPPPGYCPKCIGPRKEGPVVCPYCGLEYARFRPEEFRLSPVLSSTWLGVVEQWESKGAHDKVLALASEKGELAALGRLYRIRLARVPDDAQAKRGREEVVRLASAGSGLMHSAPPDKRVKTKSVALGFVFLLLLVAAMFIVYQAKQMLLGP
jgi:hypothetical protein